MNVHANIELKKVAVTLLVNGVPVNCETIAEAHALVDELERNQAHHETLCDTCADPAVTWAQDATVTGDNVLIPLGRMKRGCLSHPAKPRLFPAHMWRVE